MAELSEVVGAPHEARFIVDEVFGLGLVVGQPDVDGPLDRARSPWRAQWLRSGGVASRCSTSSGTGRSAAWT